MCGRDRERGGGGEGREGRGGRGKGDEGSGGEGKGRGEEGRDIGTIHNTLA